MTEFTLASDLPFKSVCLECSRKTLYSALYMMRISFLVSEVWQVGLEEMGVRKMLKKEVFLTESQPNDYVSLLLMTFTYLILCGQEVRARGGILEIN